MQKVEMLEKSMNGSTNVYLVQSAQNADPGPESIGTRGPEALGTLTRGSLPLLPLFNHFLMQLIFI